MSERTRPFDNYYSRRDAGMGYLITRLMECRYFSHLTESAVRSYLLSLVERERKDMCRMERRDARIPRIKSSGGLMVEMIYQWDSKTCGCCGHTKSRPKIRMIGISADAATAKGREIFREMVTFDEMRVQALVAWRLGVTCEVCRAYLGKSMKVFDDDQRLVTRSRKPFAVLCGSCDAAEQKDRRAWRRQNGWGTGPTEEWLLLRATERLLRKRAPRKSKTNPKEAA